MRKILTIMLVSSFIFGYVTACSIANDIISKSGGASPMPGATVKNSQDEDLGVIDDIVTGPEGRAAFAILSYSISDDLRKLIAVPVGALSCKEQSCMLNASKDALDFAPAYVSEDELADPKLAAQIYEYFGLHPYWTEEETKK